MHFGRLNQRKVDAKRVHVLDRLFEVARLSQDGNRANAAFGARAVRLHQRIRQEHSEVVPMVHVRQLPDFSYSQRLEVDA